MLFFQKKVGETPLEMLDRLRLLKPELSNEKLSYAGRLDPMAFGEILVLVGDENKEYKKYLGYDKEYVATFIVGTKTDTGDALGLVSNFDFSEVPKDKIEKESRALNKIKKQKYPWFSSKTIKGIKLFDYFKKGQTNIERPERQVLIKNISELNVFDSDSQEIKKYIKDTIFKVNGDFRQKEILEKWQEIKWPQRVQIFELKLLVTSGTYIRALTEEFSFPTTLLKLERTKIIV